MRVVIRWVGWTPTQKRHPYVVHRGRKTCVLDSGATPSRYPQFDQLDQQERMQLALDRESRRVIYSILLASVAWASEAKVALGITDKQGGSGSSGGLQGAHDYPLAGVRLVGPLGPLQRKIAALDPQSVLLNEDSTKIRDLLEPTSLVWSLNSVTILPQEVNPNYDLWIEQLGRMQLIVALNDSGSLLERIKRVLHVQWGIVKGVESQLLRCKEGKGPSLITWGWQKTHDTPEKVYSGEFNFTETKQALENEIKGRALQPVEPSGPGIIEFFRAVIASEIIWNQERSSRLFRQIVGLMKELYHELKLEELATELEYPRGYPASSYFRKLCREEPIRLLRSEETDVCPDFFGPLNDRVEAWLALEEVQKNRGWAPRQVSWGQLVQGGELMRLCPWRTDIQRITRNRASDLLHFFQLKYPEDTARFFDKQRVTKLMQEPILSYSEERYNDLLMFCQAHGRVAEQVLENLESEVHRVLRLECLSPVSAETSLEDLALLVSAGALSTIAHPIQLQGSIQGSRSEQGRVIDFEIVGDLVGFTPLPGNPLPRDLDSLAAKIRCQLPEERPLFGRCTFFESDH